MSSEETFWEDPNNSPDIFSDYKIEETPDSRFSEDKDHILENVSLPKKATGPPHPQSVPIPKYIKTEIPPSRARTPKKKERRKPLDLSISVQPGEYLHGSNIHKILKRILHLKHRVGPKGTVIFNSGDILKVIEDATKPNTRKRCKSVQTEEENEF